MIRIARIEPILGADLVVYWKTWKVIESVKFATLWATLESMTARWRISLRWSKQKKQKKYELKDLDGHVKYDAEGPERELVHGVDPVEIVEDEVEDGGASSRRSVELSSLNSLVRIAVVTTMGTLSISNEVFLASVTLSSISAAVFLVCSRFSTRVESLQTESHQ